MIMEHVTHKIIMYLMSKKKRIGSGVEHTEDQILCEDVIIQKRWTFLHPSISYLSSYK